MEEPGGLTGLSGVDDDGFKIAPHGRVRLVDHMGGDAAVVQAARVSYGPGTKTVRGDRGLIRYLMGHGHTTPFEMVQLKFHVKCPIFVARQWFRHRTGSFNEISGRYSVVTDEFFVPEVDDVGVQSSANRQGRSMAIDMGAAQFFVNLVKQAGEEAYEHYSEAIDNDIARELARIVLPLGMYTQFYWSVNLHNLYHFLELRLDSHAQQEIREFATVVALCARDVAPISFEAFMDYRLKGVRLSRQEAEIVRARLRGQEPPEDPFGGNIRERDEFEQKMGLL
jgi:thymidylate synthase (FAD)